MLIGSCSWTWSSGVKALALLMLDTKFCCTLFSLGEICSAIAIFLYVIHIMTWMLMLMVVPRPCIMEIQPFGVGITTIIWDLHHFRGSWPMLTGNRCVRPCSCTKIRLGIRYNETLQLCVVWLLSILSLWFLCWIEIVNNMKNYVEKPLNSLKKPGLA